MIDEHAPELQHLYALIESWNAANLQVALALLKGQPAWRPLVQARYGPLLQWVDRKQWRSLARLPDLLLKGEHYRQPYAPGPEQQAVLSTVPVDRLAFQGATYRMVGDWVTHLTQVQRVVVSDTCLRRMPEGLGRWQKLEQLHLKGNLLRALPDSLGELSNLQYLSIAQHHLPLLPDSIGRLSQLRFLQLLNHSERPWSLPKTLSQCENLTQLTFIHPKMGTLPLWVQDLKRLQRLHCRASGLTTLPDWLGTLPKLTHLDLSGNLFNRLPKSLTQLTQLERLNLNNTPLFIGNERGLLCGRMEIEAFFKKYFG